MHLCHTLDTLHHGYLISVCFTWKSWGKGSLLPFWCDVQWQKKWESFCQAALQISRHAAVMLWQKGYDLYVCSHSSEQNKSNCAREQVMKTLTTLNFSFMIWKIHEVILSLFKHNRESSFANCQPWRASAFGLLWRPSSSVHWTVARR